MKAITTFRLVQRKQRFTLFLLWCELSDCLVVVSAKYQKLLVRVLRYLFVNLKNKKKNRNKGITSLLLLVSFDLPTNPVPSALAAV